METECKHRPQTQTQARLLSTATKRHTKTPNPAPPGATDLVRLVHLEGHLADAVADLAEESEHTRPAEGGRTRRLGQFIVQLKELYEGRVSGQLGLLRRPIEVPQTQSTGTVDAISPTINPLALSRF